MKSCPTCQAIYPTHFTVCPRDGVALRHMSELAEGAVLRGKYKILSKLGQGGMGVVYKARHLHFDELRALKVVSSHLAEEPGFLQRFRAEALVMRRLAHPNAVRVEDFDETEDGRPFMVMEYVEGQSLDKVLATGAPLPPGGQCASPFTPAAPWRRPTGSASSTATSSRPTSWWRREPTAAM